MPAPVEAGRLAGLRRYNVVVGLILLVQAVAVVALSNDFTLPVTASLPRGAARDPSRGPGDVAEHPDRTGGRRLPGAVRAGAADRGHGLVAGVCR